MHRLLAEKMLKRFPIKLFDAPFDIEPIVEMMICPRYLDEDPVLRWIREEALSIASSIKTKQGRVLGEAGESH